MLPTAFIVVLAAFVVQASDAREIDYERVDDLSLNLVKREISQKGDSSSSQRKNDARTSIGFNGGSLNNNGPVKLDTLKEKVKGNDGFFGTLWFITKRVFKNAWNLLKECIWFPINVLMISKFKLLG